MSRHITRRGVNAAIGAALISPALAATRASAQGAEPIKIGFGMALTGPLAPNGQQALLGSQIWAEEVNAKGGLLGRQVQLVNYDDQSNPANVPGIYTKLLEVDKVDLVLSGYATNMVAPAIPVVMPKNKLIIGLFGLDANSEFKYPRYFSFIPTSGPTPRQALTEGFFQVAAAQSPKPQTIAIASEDAEFAPTPSSLASTSSTTRAIRRTRPTSHRSSARYSPQTPISWWSVRIH
jgi:branched-chain amino acid transport system substrate-binding protein